MSMDRINLLPKEKTTLQRKAPEIVFFSLFGVSTLGIALAGYNAYSTAKKYEAELETASAQLSSLQLQSKDLEAQASTQPNIQDMTFTKRILERETLLGDVMKELSMITPPKIWMLSLVAKTNEKNERNLTLTGEAISSERVTELFHALETSYYFRSVRLASSEQIFGSNPQVYRFKFDIKLPEYRYATGGHK